MGEKGRLGPGNVHAGFPSRSHYFLSLLFSIWGRGGVKTTFCLRVLVDGLYTSCFFCKKTSGLQKPSQKNQSDSVHLLVVSKQLSRYGDYVKPYK